MARITLTGMLFLVGMLLSQQAVPQGTSPSVSVSVVPMHPAIEQGSTNQLLNFDFLLENSGTTKLQLYRLQATAFDTSGGLLFRKFLVKDGDSPGIFTVPNRDLGPSGYLYVFNPFYSLDPSLHIAKIFYEFSFEAEGSQDLVSSSITVFPIEYRTKTDLILAIRDRMIVYDGHDFYSHHRRVNLGRPETRKLGFHDNPVRYAYDFCVVNGDGALYTGDATKKENWFGYGKSVYAPGAGTVVSVENEIAENSIDGKTLIYPKDMPDTILASEGNHVIIDHGNGEFSEHAHLKTGSVRVKKGDMVKQGQLIGQIGFSGDTAFHVHLHYQLMNSMDITTVGGLPSYFRNFRRIAGARVVPVTRGTVDTGEIVESTATYAK